MKLVKKKINGNLMYLDRSGVGISGNLIHIGFWEPCFTWLLKNESEGLALEVGANIGYATLIMCNSKSVSKIIAIEPHKTSRKILKKNIDINGYSKKVEIHNFALSNFKGEKKMYYTKKPNQSSLLKPKDRCKKHQVKTKTIDSLNLKPNFIKMDIEGYEIEVIDGARKTLENINKCKILLEVHPNTYSKERNFENILRYLVDIGFKFKYVVSAAVPNPDLFKERGYLPFKIMDTGGKFKRGIFKSVDANDAIHFCSKQHNQCVPGTDKISDRIVRSIMLEKGDN